MTDCEKPKVRTVMAETVLGRHFKSKFERIEEMQGGNVACGDFPVDVATLEA